MNQMTLFRVLLETARDQKFTVSVQSSRFENCFDRAFSVFRKWPFWSKVLIILWGTKNSHGSFLRTKKRVCKFFISARRESSKKVLKSSADSMGDANISENSGTAFASTKILFLARTGIVP